MRMNLDDTSARNALCKRKRMLRMEMLRTKRMRLQLNPGTQQTKSPCKSFGMRIASAFWLNFLFFSVHEASSIFLGYLIHVTFNLINARFVALFHVIH